MPESIPPVADWPWKQFGLSKVQSLGQKAPRKGTKRRRTSGVDIVKGIFSLTVYTPKLGRLNLTATVIGN